MQYHTYQHNSTRGSSPPFAEDQLDEPGALPPRRAEPQDDPLPQAESPKRPSPAEEPLWQDDGGEG